ncbi:hypothetical protein GCM10027422_20110 [Hymenobacter arcticus]
MKHLFLLAGRLGTLLGLALTLHFAAAAQPIVTALAPTAAAAGATVTITGAGFAATPAQNAVYFGIGRATVTAATATQLTVRVPVGASSVAPVTVANLATRQLGSSLASGTPFFTVTFAGPGLNANSYRATSYPLGTSRVGSSALATADFNADNYPDFAVLADNKLNLLLSDGQGGYGPPLTLEAGASPTYLKAADVDANGAPDLLVGGSLGLVLLRNLGSGNGFTTALPLDLGGPRRLDAAAFTIDVQDMNADGLPDLLLILGDLNPLTGLAQLVELRNNGTGFDAPALLLSERLVGQVVADFTRDGKPDVLVQVQASTAATGTQLLVLARNAANTGYDAPAALPVVPLFLAAGGVQLADVTGDSLPDLLGLDQSSAGLYGIAELVRTATGFTKLGPFNLLPASTISYPLPQAVADLDGNGLVDVLASAGGNFAVLPGQAGGGLGQPLTFGAAGAKLVAGDFDRDGRTDVATFDFTTGSLTIYHYTGASANTNNPPTLNPLTDLTIDEDAPQQAIALSGISNGGEPGQAVTLTAVSSNPALIPTPTIAYFSPTSTGTLRLKPAPDAFGTCTITVTAADGQAQTGTITRSFQVTVNPVNDAPTLDPIPDVVITTATSAAQLSIPLSGITAGAANENQLLTLSLAFTWNDPNIFGGYSSNITYISPATTGRLDFGLVVTNNTPRLLGTLMVTVNDGQPSNNTLTRTFRIYYNPGGTAPNIPSSPPTLDALADLTANRSLATQLPVALTGITDGDPSQVLPLTVTAVSSDPDLVSIGVLSYASPAATGSLPYTISSTRGGTATVSVTVRNGQPQNGSILRSFRITVPGTAVVTATTGTASNPTFSLYPNPAPGGRFAVASPVTGPLDVTVLDLTGRTVLAQRLAAGQQALALPAGTAQGVYLVRVRTTQGTATRRLVVE